MSTFADTTLSLLTTENQTIDDLTFTLERYNKRLIIWGHLPDDEIMYMLVDCSIEKGDTCTEVTIDDFCYSAHGRGSDYYKKARTILRKHNRTIGGVLMEAIKTYFTAETDATGKEIYITIGCDVWSTKDSTNNLNSHEIQVAADNISSRGKEKGWTDLSTLIDTDDDAETYVLYRYQRLYPKQEKTFEDYLFDLIWAGWYSPWITDRIDVQEMGETKALI